jgi:hypothetical protein
VTDSDRTPPPGRPDDPLAAFPRAPLHGSDRGDQPLARSAGPSEPTVGAPSVEQAIMLREQAPELYDLWLKIAQEKAATANYVDRAPYEVPERLAQSGRPRALGALIIVLSFCGYLSWLGGPGIYIGGVIAILDLIAMLAVLFALRPDRLAEPRRAERPRRRRLPAAAAYPPRGPAPAPPALSPPPPTGREEPQTASMSHRCGCRARRGITRRFASRLPPLWYGCCESAARGCLWPGRTGVFMIPDPNPSHAVPALRGLSQRLTWLGGCCGSTGVACGAGAACPPGLCGHGRLSGGALHCCTRMEARPGA